MENKYSLWKGTGKIKKNFPKDECRMCDKFMECNGRGIGFHPEYDHDVFIVDFVANLKCYLKSSGILIMSGKNAECIITKSED